MDRTHEQLSNQYPMTRGSEMTNATKHAISIVGTCAGRHEPADAYPRVWHEKDWQEWVLSCYRAQGLTEEESRLATNGLNARADHEPYWVGVLCDFDGQPRRHCVVPIRQGGFYISEIPVWRRSAEMAGELLRQWQEWASASKE